MLPPGYTRRPLRPDDVTAVAELYNALEAHFLDEPDDLSPSDLRGWWKRLELERDTVAVFDPDGRLVAAADVHPRQPENLDLDLDGYVHPDAFGRGLGAFLVEWAENEARGRDVERLRVGILAVDEAAGRLLRGRGFEPIRHFYRMMIDLDERPPAVEWPAGFVFSTFQLGDEEALHATIEEAFAEHWGHVERDLEHFRRMSMEQEWWDPSLVYLVREGDQVAAASINARRFGMGFVNVIGTRKPWRGRGLARALLFQAFGDLYDRGERQVGLGVDAGNETGATQLYEAVGMRISSQADVYEEHL